MQDMFQPSDSPAPLLKLNPPKACFLLLPIGKDRFLLQGADDFRHSFNEDARRPLPLRPHESCCAIETYSAFRRTLTATSGYPLLAVLQTERYKPPSACGLFRFSAFCRQDTFRPGSAVQILLFQLWSSLTAGTACVLASAERNT